MKITKQISQNILSSFAWDYREVFFEKSKWFSILAINGEFRTPHYSTLEGFSLLSRSGKNEYFKVFWDFENMEQKWKAFSKEFDLKGEAHQIVLDGEDLLELNEVQNISFDVKDILQSAKDMFHRYIANHPCIVWSEMTLNLSKKSFVVANSDTYFAKDENFYTTFFLKLVGEKDGKREEIYEKITGNDILDQINSENIQKVIQQSIEVLEKQLDGIPTPSGKLDVVIGNEAGGTIIHEAVGHGLEADLQNSSVYKGRIGEKVADSKVTIVDNPTTIGERWFYRYDHEWHQARYTTLIENWVLKSYLHNSKTAQKFGVSSTGHARRETYKYKTLVRMGNTYMLPGKDKKQDLISQISYGIYVSRMWWWQVNTTTWDFVFKVQNGYLIEDGKLTQNITGATLSWNGPEMLHEIYGICDDLNFFDGWTCGKWQSMPVSDGVPTIWTKLKVSWVE